MPIKLFGINPAQGVTNPFQVNNKQFADKDFAKASFDIGTANPNRPEHRGDGIHGLNLYCLG